MESTDTGSPQGQPHGAAGRQDQHGHCVVEFTDVRVPVENLIGAENAGVAVDEDPRQPGVILCPTYTESTAACATCSARWGRGGRWS